MHEIINLANRLLKSTSSLSLRKELKNSKYEVDITIKKEDIYEIKKINEYIYKINEDIYISEIFTKYDFNDDLKFNRKYSNILYRVD